MSGFGDHYGQSALHPVGLIAVLVLGALLLGLPRQYAVWPMILMACFIPSGQRLVVGGADFTLLRILILFGWMRIVSRNEFKAFTWTRLDAFSVCWMSAGTIVYTLQYGTTSALVNRAGWLFDGLGMYFLFRCVIRDWADVTRLAQAFAVVATPVAFALFLEWSTGRNAFSVFGGVPAMTDVREGKLRCQGAFSHAILAGCFWASVIPLMVALGRSKVWLAGCGIASSLFIVVACASSTPVMAVAFAIFGLAVYKIRAHTRYVRWSAVAVLLLLSVIMSKPIWHIMARVNVLSGSTGWHRYQIMDATINNIGQWWLLGESNPMSWGVWEMRDITNQYILEGLRGGLLTLVLFIAVLTTAFRMIGRAMRRVKTEPEKRLMVWCVGVCLFIHVMTFFAVSYFGQIIMLVYLTLALVGSIHSMTQREEAILPATLRADSDMREDWPPQGLRHGG